MNETFTQKVQAWGGYLGLIVIILVLQGLPLNTAPSQFAPPDMTLILTIAFVLRFPKYASPILIGAVLLFCDFVMQRPPGLWALVVFCISLVLRARSSEMKETVFGAEWLVAAIGVVACYFLYIFMLIITFLPTPNLRLAILQAGLTLLCYPIAAWVLHILLPKPAMSAPDTISKKVGR